MVSVSADAWAHLLSASGPHFYEPGAVLLRQGGPATHVLPLVAGRVKAFRTAQDGSVLVLAIRGPGEILGDIAVLGRGSRSATVVAVDRCETRIIPADRFLQMVSSLRLEAQLRWHAMARIRESEAWRAEIATLPAGPRLVRTLLRLAVPGPAGSGDIGLDQTELGQAAGLSRSTVAAELARLREQGLVTTARRRIIVHDVRRLQCLARSGQGGV